MASFLERSHETLDPTVLTLQGKEALQSPQMPVLCAWRLAAARCVHAAPSIGAGG